MSEEQAMQADGREAASAQVAAGGGSGALNVRLAEKMTSIGLYSHDALVVNPVWADAQQLGENEPVLVGVSGKPPRIAARIVMSNEVEAGQARLSRRWREQLAVETGDLLAVSRCSLKTYGCVLPQRVESVGEPVVQIPSGDAHLLDGGDSYYRLICEGTNCELVVAREHIETFESSGERQEECVKLDRYQRKLLKLELPVELTSAMCARYVKRIGDADRSLIESIYASGQRDAGISYEDAKDGFSALEKVGYSRIYLAPLYDAEHAGDGGSRCAQSARRTPWRFLCDSYLGTSSIVLRGIRPYELDESKRVVRMSSGTMAYLGIDDTDRVRISYGDASITARAMPIDDFHELQMTNLLADDDTADNLVGIPVALRNELGLGSIDTCVNVERDTTYLFVKHLNIQFLALVGLLLTLLQTIPAFDIDPLYVIVAFIVALPFVLYAILSGERNRVG